MLQAHALQTLARLLTGHPEPSVLAVPGSREEPFVDWPTTRHSKPTNTNGATSHVLILGLGNDILTDDAVGLHVVRELRQRLAGEPEIVVEETCEMGLALLDFFVGHRAVILVDSIQTGRVPPGTVHELDATELKQLSGRTPHFLGVGETLALGRHLGLPMPDQVTVFAIEVEDPFTLGTAMTPAIAQAIPDVVKRVVTIARQLAEIGAERSERQVVA